MGSAGSLESENHGSISGLSATLSFHSERISIWLDTKFWRDIILCDTLTGLN